MLIHSLSFSIYAFGPYSLYLQGIFRPCPAPQLTHFPVTSSFGQCYLPSWRTTRVSLWLLLCIVEPTRKHVRVHFINSFNVFYSVLFVVVIVYQSINCIVQCSVYSCDLFLDSSTEFALISRSIFQLDNICYWKTFELRTPLMGHKSLSQWCPP